MYRYNYRINYDLTGYTVKNTEKLVEFLRSVGITIQHGSENDEFFWLYTEITEEEVPFQWSKSISTSCVENGYTLNYELKKQPIHIISLNDLVFLISDKIRYSIYGLSFGLKLIENWKPTDIYSLNNYELFDNYFNWRIKKDPKETKKLERLRTCFKVN